MFKEIETIMESYGAYDFETQVILNRNVIIKAYIKVKKLREIHGFEIDFDKTFWSAAEILSNLGIILPRFTNSKNESLKQSVIPTINKLSV